MNELKHTFLKNLKLLRFSQKEVDDISFAFDIAYHAHLTQKRDCGKDYISHPVEGCIVMAKEFNIREAILYIAFLLHDVGEDTTLFGNRSAISYENFAKICSERVTRIFGSEVASLVVTLTKPAVGREFKDKKSMMFFYLSQMEQNYHAVLLKMIDRLHNLRSLVPGDKKKINRQITETEKVLMPTFQRAVGDAVKVCDPIHENMSAILHTIMQQLNRLKKQSKI